MAIKNVAAWMTTSDGTLYANEQAAREHEARRLLSEKLEQSNAPSLGGYVDVLVRQAPGVLRNAAVTLFPDLGGGAKAPADAAVRDALQAIVDCWSDDMRDKDLLFKNLRPYIEDARIVLRRAGP